MNRVGTSAAAVLVGVAVGCARTPTLRPPPPNNLMVVVLDDVGIDLVSAYGVGSLPAPMPTFDALAADGVLFERAYATPVCSSTRAALLTGRYGRRTGVGGVIGDVDPPFALPDAEVTLAEMLRSAPTPYTSAAVGKWHLANQRSFGWAWHPLSQGFARFSGTPGNLGGGEFGSFGYYDWIKDENGLVTSSKRYATTDTVDDAIRFARELPEPWMLYVAFNAPHPPFHSPPAALVHALPGNTLDPAELTRSVLEAADHEFGRLLASIDPAVRARTTIVWLGDNGTVGGAILPPSDPEESKSTLHEGGVHVPLVVSGAGVAAKGQRCGALVDVVDLFPTLAELAGVNLASIPGPGGGPVVLDGASLAPYLGDPGLPSQRRAIYAERFAPNGPPPYTTDWRSVRDERYAMLWSGRDQVALYDLTLAPPTDGPDLLLDGVSADERVILDGLWAELAPYAEMSYDHGEYGRPPEVPPHAGGSGATGGTGDTGGATPP